jgi:OFA family oxalate/formate antiporter-like MFS transporter
MRRYLVVAAAVVMQVCLGGVYAWSVFVPPLRAQFGYSSTQTQLVFGFTIALLCAASLATGPLHDRFGPRRLAMTGGLFLMSGYLLASVGGGRFPVLLAALGGLNGMAVACCYLSAVATGVKWFPNNKGLVSGITIAGYGGGAILLSAIARLLLARGWPVLDIFRAVGLVYGPLVILAGSAMSVPAGAQAGAESVSYRRLLRDRRFWLIAAGMFCGTYPGLAVIGNLKPLGLSFGVSDRTATLAISALALGSFAGRIAWGAFQDRVGTRRATLLSLGMVGLSLLALFAGRGNGTAFLLQAVFVGFCYGGSLALYTSQIPAFYGSARFGKIYSLAIQAHGLAAIIAPATGGAGFDLLGGMDAPIGLAAGVSFAGLVVCKRLMARTEGQ